MHVCQPHALFSFLFIISRAVRAKGRASLRVLTPRHDADRAVQPRIAINYPTQSSCSSGLFFAASRVISSSRGAPAENFARRVYRARGRFRKFLALSLSLAPFLAFYYIQGRTLNRFTQPGIRNVTDSSVSCAARGCADTRKNRPLDGSVSEWLLILRASAVLQLLQ